MCPRGTRIGGAFGTQFYAKSRTGKWEFRAACLANGSRAAESPWLDPGKAGGEVDSLGSNYLKS